MSRRAGILLLVATQALLAQTPAPGPAIQPANARPAETLGGLAGPGFALAYGEKDGTLVVACEHRAIHAWHRPAVLGIRTGDNTPHVLQAHKAPITALAWDGGATMASAGGDHKILLWSMPEAKLRAELTGHTSPIRSLALAPDGKLLASAGDDALIRLWDVATGKLVRLLEGDQDWLMALAFSPDGKALASGGYGGTIRLWNISGPDKIPLVPFQPAPLADQGYHVLALAYGPDGKQVAAGSTDGQIRIFSAVDGTLIRAITGHTSSVTSLAYHASGTVLASSSKDRTVRLWNPANGQAYKVLEGHQSWVNGVAFVDRGVRLASVSADQTVRLWDLTPTK